MKRKHGITLIMLAIVIIIMTILLSVTAITGTSIYNDTTKAKLSSEIVQIELLIKNYIMRNSDIDFDMVTIDISEYTEQQKLQFAAETITDNKITLYIVDLEKIDATEVLYGTSKYGVNDRYLYSIATGKVYHEKGVNIGSKVYHRIDK